MSNKIKRIDSYNVPHLDYASMVALCMDSHLLEETDQRDALATHNEDIYRIFTGEYEYTNAQVMSIHAQAWADAGYLKAVLEDLR